MLIDILFRSRLEAKAEEESSGTASDFHYSKIIKMAFFLKKFRKNATSTRWLLLIVRMIFKFEVHSSSILYFFNYFVPLGLRLEETFS